MGGQKVEPFISHLTTYLAIYIAINTYIFPSTDCGYYLLRRHQQWRGYSLVPPCPAFVVLSSNLHLPMWTILAPLYDQTSSGILASHAKRAPKTPAPAQAVTYQVLQ